MQDFHRGRHAVAQYKLTTERFAALNGVKGQSVRARVCRFGSYFGITPRRLKNGRLIWPVVQVAAACSGSRK